MENGHLLWYLVGVGVGGALGFSVGIGFVGRAWALSERAKEKDKKA